LINQIHATAIVQLIQPEDDNKIIYLWGETVLPFVTTGGFGYAGYDCAANKFDVKDSLLMIHSDNTLKVTNGCITASTVEQYKQGPDTSVCLNGEIRKKLSTLLEGLSVDDHLWIAVTITFPICNPALVNLMAGLAKLNLDLELQLPSSEDNEGNGAFCSAETSQDVIMDDVIFNK
jgi:hypothetical protein